LNSLLHEMFSLMNSGSFLSKFDPVKSRTIVTSCLRLAGSGTARDYDAQTIIDDEKKGVFRVLQIGKDNQVKKRDKGMMMKYEHLPERSQKMVPDQRWGNVWPAAKTFHPSVVPLPVRQGVVQQKAQVVPSKRANAELMKIPNFLHLTPPVIKEHCAAISKFCTEWPTGLETDEEIAEHFPVHVTYSDYLNSSSSIRDRRSRIVQLRINIKSIPLDEHAKDKFIRLVGDRYNEDTGEILLSADRCPYRGQNLDYCKYLLTALLHESWKVEDWELKQVEDREIFVANDEVGCEREALQRLLNEGETEASVKQYKEEVRKLLGLPETIAVAEPVS